MDIDEVFSKLISTSPKPPNTYKLSLDESNLKELFEFLLEIFTMLCKHFHGDEDGRVELQLLSTNDLIYINKYMGSLGFNCIFNQVQTNSSNCEYYSQNRYDKIEITPTTNLLDLFFALRCNNTLNIIQFNTI